MVALMTELDAPHFRFPFQLNATASEPVVVDQDEDDEVLDSVTVLLATIPGTRVDLPDFGLDEQAFVEGGAKPGDILQALKVWEPRANLILERDDVSFPDYAQHVRLNYRTGASGA
jgi:phage baseplate assembly protein W